jgi:peroxiredoxin
MKILTFMLMILLVCPAPLLGRTGNGGTPLQIGDPAPDFTLPFATQDTINKSGITLSSVVGRGNIVLAFYPADWSGGCTTEMCTMRDNFSALAGLDATVFGISGDYVYSHHEWAKFHHLPFALLSDHSHIVARAYNSFNAETGYNRRTVYVIGRDGRIAYVDLAYAAGSPASFDMLKATLSRLR